MKEAILESRTLFEKPSGFLSVLNPRLRNHRKFEIDCKGDDIPSALLPHYQILLAQGRIVWEAIAQANTSLFRPGNNDLPCSVVYRTSLKSSPMRYITA
jgi:hypothetical protein